MMFQFGNVSIGRDKPPFIIADACYNHLGNMDIAIKMIEYASKVETDCIKFQHLISEDCMLPSTPVWIGNRSAFDYMKEIAFTIEEHKILMNECKKNDILYLCTPFGHDAIDELVSAGVDIVKVGSGEVMDFGFLEHITSHKLKMIVSTGMCSWKEIIAIHDFLVDKNAEFAMLHCISEYPPKYSHINLQVISAMYKQFGDKAIGFSDHTPDNYISFAAVALGASIIEKHYILDKKIPGPDANISVDVEGLRDLVAGTMKVYSALISPRKYTREMSTEEERIAAWARRSIVSVARIPDGYIIREDMLVTRRPGTGIPANLMKNVIGKRARRDIEAKRLITWDDIE